MATTGQVSKFDSGHGQLLYFWKSFFISQYFLLNCPFRLQVRKSEENSKVIAVSWLPQKVSCASITILGLVYHFEKVYTSLPTNPKNPRAYLYLGLQITRVISNLVRVKLYWFDQSELLKILNVILKKPHFHIPDNSVVKLILQKKIGTFMYLVFLCVHIALVAERLTTTSWTKMVTFGRNNIFSGNETTHTGDIFVGVVTYVGYFWYRVTGYYAEVFTLLVAFTTWLPAKALAEQLHLSIKHCREFRGEIHKACVDTFNPKVVYQEELWLHILSQYHAIKKLTGLVNNVFGSVHFYFILSIVLEYSVDLDFFLSGGTRTIYSILWTLIIFFFLSRTCGALILSADVCKQVQKNNKI